MRALLVLAIAIAACRPASIDPGTTVPVRLEPHLYDIYTGRWEGTSYREDDPTPSAWILQQFVSVGGTPVGRLSFVGTTIPPADIRFLEATDSTFATVIGPYYSPTVEGEVLTRVEGRMAGDRMWGNWRAQPVGGGDTVEGRFEAMRVRATP